MWHGHIFWLIQAQLVDHSWLTNYHFCSFYQEFLGKSLTEKYGALNTQMDKIIHNANSEISNLQTRMFGLSNLVLLSTT